MERALVVVREGQNLTELLGEAGRLAAGVGAELVVLGVRSESDYRATQTAVAAAGGAGPTFSQATEAADSWARRSAREALADVDVDYRTRGVVADDEEEVLEAAVREGCDHLFVAGRRRSPAGKAVFGDLTQRLLLSFDGPVTVLLDDE